MVDRTTRPIVPHRHISSPEHRRLLAERANAAFPRDGTGAMNAPFRLQEVATSDLPDPSLWPGALIFDTTDGVPKYSDGTEWLEFLPDIVGQTEDLTPAPADVFLLQRDSDEAYRKVPFSVMGGADAANQAQQEAATATDVYTSPGRQQFHPSAAKAWGYANGAGTSLLANYNISSITDNGPGDLTWNWGTSFSSSNYAIAATIIQTAGRRFMMMESIAAGSARTNVTNDGGAAANPEAHFIAAYGDQP